jgi:iron complex outermembrane recepter protein
MSPWNWCCRALTLVGAEALAQEAATPTPPVNLDRVEITGSHVRRSESEPTLPVQVLTREDIERSGSTNVPELMRLVSANIGSFGDAQSMGTQTFGGPTGLSSVNLRGIGSTLILINGRRVANYAFDGGTADVNSIPLAAIDRVEILKDGASAIYGTDAIGGVVNFILRKNYRGAELTGNVSRTQHGGAGHQQETALFGVGDPVTNGFNAFITLDHQKDKALRAADRSFSLSGYQPSKGLFNINRVVFPANVVTASGQYLSPALASGCAPPASIPVATPGESPLCWSNSGFFIDLLPSSERTAVFARAAQQTRADLQLFTEIGFTHNRILTHFAPTFVPTATSNGQPFVYPAGGPFYPTAFANANGLSGDLTLGYRTVELGKRTNLVDTKATRVLVGVDGLLLGWDFGAAILRSTTRESDAFVSGWVSQERLLSGLATGLINPFGPSGPEGLALLASSQTTGAGHVASGSTTLIDAKASKEVYRLRSGPVRIALGIEARRERLDNEFSAEVTNGDVLNANGTQPIGGARSAQALYAEAVVPLATGFETQLAVRNDRYSDFGSTWNPKIALRWQPAKALMLRSSWGTGFRAPTLPDLYTPPTTGLTSFRTDPVRCPVTGLPEDCQRDFTVIGGGNPALQPERSNQFNVGLVWEPSVPLSVAIDFWKITRKHTIGTISEDSLFLYPGQFSANFVRGPSESAFPGLPGPIQSILETNQNTGQWRTAGFDVGVNYRSPATAWGRFGFSLNGTYISEWKAQQEDGSFISGVGNNDLFATIPRWRHYLALNWESGAWGATLGQSYQHGYRETLYKLCDANGICPDTRVDAYRLLDLQVTYAGIKHAKITMGVKNLLDRAPPFVAFSGGSQNGYAVEYADPRGRSFYASLTLAY